MANLSQTDIKYLPGVGPKKAEILNKELGIYSVEDLLYYFPYKYIDRSRIYYIHEIDGNMPYIQLKGRITAFESAGEGRNKRLIAHFTDGTGFIDLVWFQGARFMQDKYKVNNQYLVFGKPTLFGKKFNIAHPDIDPYIDGSQDNMGLMGYYNTSEKMKKHYLNSKALQKIISSAFSSVHSQIAETLPDYVIRDANLMDLKSALRNIHSPENPALLRQAQYRLKFEELFYIQLNILRYTKNRNKSIKGHIFRQVGDIFNTFYHKNLPFELTNAQKRIIKEVRQDMATGKQMNRLLQGDVGSGKTLVALMLMLIALDNGFQASMMVPTEILATQHFQSISELLFGMDVRVELLTGSTKKSARTKILSDLLTGEVDILIGTHALIEDTVVFDNLGLVVIDEQHRFGVAQRAKLWRKNSIPPHILVMTATPIPRTLAMTVYGDLDVSVIDELPPGRKPIQTIHQFDKRRAALYQSVRKQLQEGRQVYFVYPLIEESETLDLRNLEEGFEHIKEVFPDYKVCKVHGKMKPKDKDAEMQLFVNNEAQIMVATTVIEVGVNVPNASVMVIESAQRFGLSQLHQLRGRVGRGADQSFCILITPYELSAETKKRISIMVESNDGFEIAEADLKLRGPGDLEGTQQSGVAFNLKIANIVRDGDILQYAREVAAKIIESDENLEYPNNQILKIQLKKLSASNVNWGLIS
ncbi:ATP-dependent DNA helicase RecG [Dysgonomonas sp. 520]|uniref:ATP-dependent DNA helicase RecG n=1 Tax=Dysgonomonas sp. 520 TaxID=2302931 RepID=UPI0013D18734|nr:ATP-dependent DNA helicase RecG [Dysgonomonas sp. 520]NDW10538.1 ATP-dependent DNA helicase RecG [Dysgonomonas sp. 520]